MNTNHPLGVSIIICCHNSARRLPETLRHLAAQQTSIPWEVIVVDNASTDNTAQVARDCWTASAVPFRVVAEPRPGLMNARKAGIQLSRFEFLSFVDDDNWVCSVWVTLVAELLTAHPEAAACGGRNEPIFEAPAPAWFDEYQECFAVGPQGDASGPVSTRRAYLCGAGFSVRRSAIEQLSAAGFRSLLVGRTGKSLASGEDTEMSAALMLSGWTLWYDSRLRLKHFIPRERLTWNYLRGLHRGFGASSAWLGIYHEILQGTREPGWKGAIRRTWLWQLQTAARNLLRQRKLVRSRGAEGDRAVLEFEFMAGRTRELLRHWWSYDRRVRHIENAPWRKAQAIEPAAMLAVGHEEAVR